MIEYKSKLIVDTIEELLDSSNIVDTISKDDHGNKYSNNIVTFDTESCPIDEINHIPEIIVQCNSINFGVNQKT